MACTRCHVELVLLVRRLVDAGIGVRPPFNLRPYGNRGPHPWGFCYEQRPRLMRKLPRATARPEGDVWPQSCAAILTGAADLGGPTEAPMASTAVWPSTSVYPL